MPAQKDFKLTSRLEQMSAELCEKIHCLTTKWSKESSEVIPQDDQLAHELTELILDVTHHAEESGMDSAQLTEWLHAFAVSFSYGPEGDGADSFNYLDFDEGSLYEIITSYTSHPTKPGYNAFKKRLESLAKKYRK